MDELTRRLRELMKPIANRPPFDVEDDATEEEKKVLKHLEERAQAFARRFLSETAK
jgi:hypothetical protein